MKRSGEWTSMDVMKLRRVVGGASSAGSSSSSGSSNAGPPSPSEALRLALAPMLTHKSKCKNEKKVVEDAPAGIWQADRPILSDLPPELLSAIFRPLDPLEHINLTLTCAKFRSIIRDSLHSPARLCQSRLLSVRLLPADMRFVWEGKNGERMMEISPFNAEGIMKPEDVADKIIENHKMDNVYFDVNELRVEFFNSSMPLAMKLLMRLQFDRIDKLTMCYHELVASRPEETLRVQQLGMPIEIIEYPHQGNLCRFVLERLEPERVSVIVRTEAYAFSSFRSLIRYNAVCMLYVNMSPWLLSSEYQTTDELVFELKPSTLDKSLRVFGDFLVKATSLIRPPVLSHLDEQPGDRPASSR